MKIVFSSWYFSLVLFFGGLGISEERNWTNLQGRTIRAAFVSQVEGLVKIRNAKGEFEVEISSLSEADQTWLREQAQKSPTGGGVYIAAGHGGHRMSSIDGLNWTHHEFWDKPAHNQNDLKAIAAGNGICVVVGGFSKSNILTTTDGIAWHRNEFNIGVLSGVFFVDDRFIVFGESGRVGASTDGMIWELIGDGKLRDFQNKEMEELELDKPVKSNIRRWRYANDTFVGVGDNCIAVSTQDFETWKFTRTIEPRSRLFIESDGKGFVAHGDRTLHYSVDGHEWKQVTPEIDDKTRFLTLTHDGERYILNSRTGNGWESSDGQNWKAISGATFPETIAAIRPDLLYSFSIYWKYTEDLKVSRDGGKSWQSTKIPAPTGVTCVVHAKGIKPFK